MIKNGNFRRGGRMVLEAFITICGKDDMKHIISEIRKSANHPVVQDFYPMNNSIGRSSLHFCLFLSFFLFYLLFQIC